MDGLPGPPPGRRRHPWRRHASRRQDEPDAHQTEPSTISARETYLVSLIYASMAPSNEKSARDVDAREPALYKSLPSTAPNESAAPASDSVSENWIAEESVEFSWAH
ncbi:MAG: hypothetical protein R3B06_32340, partial [Kofleriaceae bacterium]